VTWCLSPEANNPAIRTVRIDRIHGKIELLKFLETYLKSNTRIIPRRFKHQSMKAQKIILCLATFSGSLLPIIAMQATDARE
jgi:hypothetical protein